MNASITFGLVITIIGAVSVIGTAAWMLLTDWPQEGGRK